MSTNPEPENGSEEEIPKPNRLIPAIKVVHAMKSFSQGKPILDNLSMTVPANSIYALLGSSGCGKTTMLSCCIGLRKLDSGEVTLFGHAPGTKESGVPGRRIGYMPQDISLYNELTIEEILAFFGRVYGMTADQISAETDFLLDFLDLPKPHRKVSTLSSGQQRRASMAVTLIHDPELLILDEPTVGVDPLLRESIWEYIVGLVTHGRTTVIVTTHYIEEAKQAHTIGIMRNGRLLEEKPPELLLEAYNTRNLEDVVIYLCRRDNIQADLQREGHKRKLGKLSDPDPEFAADLAAEGASDYSLNGVVASSPGLGKNKPPPQEGSKTVLMGKDEKMKLVSGRHEKIRNRKTKRHHIGGKIDILMKVTRVFAVFRKELVSMERNFMFLVFLFVVPAVEVALICLLMGLHPKGVKLAIVSKDGEDCSKILNYNTCPFSTGKQHLISCYFTHFIRVATSPPLPKQDPRRIFKIMNYVKKSGIKRIQKTEAKVIKKFNDGDLDGYLIFPKNFSRAFECRFAVNVETPFAPGCGLGWSDSEVLRMSTIKTVADFTDIQLGYAIGGGIMNATTMFTKLLKAKCEPLSQYKWQLGKLGEFMKFDKRPEISSGPKFYMVTGSLLALLFFLPLCASSIMYIMERKNGTMERMMVAGVTPGEFMAAFLISQFVLLIGQAIIALVIMHLFDVKIPGGLVSVSGLLAISLTVLVGISGMAGGFAFAMICSSEVEAILGGIAMFLPLGFLSGTFIPTNGAEWEVMVYITYIVPCTLACDGLRAIVGNGAGLDNIQVLIGFGATIAWIVVLWTLAIILHRTTGKS